MQPNAAEQIEAATRHIPRYGSGYLVQNALPFQHVMALMADVQDAPIDCRQRNFGDFRFVRRRGKLLLFQGYGLNVIVPMLFRSAATTARLFCRGGREWMKDLTGDLDALVQSVSREKRSFRVKEDKKKNLTKEERRALPYEIIYKPGPIYVAASGTESLEMLRAAAGVFEHPFTLYTIDLELTNVPLPANVKHVSFVRSVNNPSPSDHVQVGVALHPRMQLI